jgi:hypothetical protein
MASVFTRCPSPAPNETTTNGCICHYTLAVQPANLVGALLIRSGFFKQVAAKFGIHTGPCLRIAALPA